MENRIFWKSISFNCKYYGFDLEIVLHFYFHFKPFLDSDAQRGRERERERERERGDHWYSPSHELTHSQRAPPSPSLQMQPILSLTLFRKFPLSLENFSPHSLSSFTPSPSRRTERAIASKTQI